MRTALAALAIIIAVSIGTVLALPGPCCNPRAVCSADCCKDGCKCSPCLCSASASFVDVYAGERRGRGAVIKVGDKCGILTAKHVTEGAKSIRVRSQDEYESHDYAVGTSADSTSVDLAIVFTVKPINLPPLVVSERGTLHRGSELLTFARHGDLPGSLVKYYVDYPKYGQRLVLTGFVEPGFSGSAIVQAQHGHLAIVGVAVEMDRVTKACYCVPASDIAKFLENVKGAINARSQAEDGKTITVG